MDRPRLLDLFCGSGGAACGYNKAGFDVVGVDIEEKKEYPYEFHCADALTYPLEGFDAIHASPPCQDYSSAMRHLAGDFPRLIDPIRERLKTSGVPWVIENVPGSSLPAQTDLFGSHGVELCGSMFNLEWRGLMIYRHRLFETSFPVAAPRGCDHSRYAFNPHNSDGRELIFARNGKDDPERPWRETMGVGWMSFWEGRESVPPAYTAYMGACLLTELAPAGTLC